MRVISGKYKGHSINKVPFHGTRPTQARVRKSMLQILEPFHEKSVLDLFAGSGILGIEAVSRGADSLVSIENDKKIFKLLNKNLSKVCKQDNYECVLIDAMKFLESSNKKFDFIICDPPYDKYDYLEIFNKSVHLLNHRGVFCMEMRKKDVDKSIFRTKIYGNTQIIIWEAI
tara:strand:+ start:236 stop:751 length:516 start_codon:yes stop_codon:yes gene_type:complete